MSAQSSVENSSQRREIRLFGKQMPLPSSRPLRIVLGAGLIGGGLVGFLPILGFWMVPLGVVVLSTDIPAVRRFRRRAEVAILRRWRGSASPAADPDTPPGASTPT